MRRILLLLVTLAVGAAALAALWIFQGREFSSFIDRYWTLESGSAPIQSIGYEGSGTGGILIVNDVSLSLNDVRPDLSLSVGTTKDNQLALATFWPAHIHFRGYRRTSRYCPAFGRSGLSCNPSQRSQLANPV